MSAPDHRICHCDGTHIRLWCWQARNTNIIEDLGRVAYVFSDKTGTLTSNEMRLRAVSVKGVPYGSIDFR
jgi:P-type E1-E2 ATPase